MDGPDNIKVIGRALSRKYVFFRFWWRKSILGDFQPPFSKLLATPLGGALGALSSSARELLESKNRMSMRWRIRVLDTHGKSIYYNILKKLAHVWTVSQWGGVLDYNPPGGRSPVLRMLILIRALTGPCRGPVLNLPLVRREYQKCAFLINKRSFVITTCATYIAQ